MSSFSYRQGRAAMKQSGDTVLIYAAIVIGIVIHWVWEILVAGVTGDGTFKFGTVSVIVARIAIAFIAGAWSFTGVYQQIKEAPFRGIAAFTAGFAVDAFTGPVVDGAAS